MDKFDLRDLIDYAERHDMMQHTFMSVYTAWTNDIKEAYEESEADMYNSTIEAHEL